MSTRERTERSVSAPISTYRQSAPEPVTGPEDSFVAGLRTLARELRKTIPDLAADDRDWLYELAREESRYPMPTVRRLCGLARKSRSAAVRNAFAELIRRECLAGEDVTVTNAFGLELRTNGPDDIASRDFEKDRNPITYARAKVAIQQQIAASELKLLTLVRYGRAQGWESAEHPAAGRTKNA